MDEEEVNNDLMGWDQYGRRRAEGRSRVGAALGAAAEAAGYPLSYVTTRPYRWLFGGQQDAAPATTYTPYADPYDVAMQRIATARQSFSDPYQAARERYADVSSRVLPLVQGQQESINQAWQQAIGNVDAQQAAINAMAGQTGQAYRGAGEETQLAAQRILGQQPVTTSVGGMGVATGVPAADYAGQAGQAANVQARAAQAALGAQAGQLDDLGRLLAAQQAAYGQQLGTNVQAQLAAAQIAFNEQARQEAAANEAMIRQMQLEADIARQERQQLVPFLERQWDGLSKDDKKSLKSQGVTNRDEYIQYEFAKRDALGLLSQGQ